MKCHILWKMAGCITLMLLEILQFGIMVFHSLPGIQQILPKALLNLGIMKQRGVSIVIQKHLMVSANALPAERHYDRLAQSSVG